jgi:hypothetical protein
MKIIIFLFALSLSCLVHADNFDSTVNFQPGLNLYPEVATLTDLFGPSGSELCAPVAITHAFNFLKWGRNPAFSHLATVPDLDQDGVANSYRDQVRYFFESCKTDRATGTGYFNALDCMGDFIRVSNYTSWNYMLGPDAQVAPPGYGMPDVKHAVAIPDLMYYVKNGAAVIMTAGWYKLNAATNKYERAGGHFFNVYGFDYMNAWGDTQLIIKTVNSLVDYSGRDRTQMFDNVSMVNVANDPQIPTDWTHYELTGAGLNFPGYKTLVEDILVMLPVGQ